MKKISEENKETILKILSEYDNLLVFKDNAEKVLLGLTDNDIKKSGVKFLEGEGQVTYENWVDKLIYTYNQLYETPITERDRLFELESDIKHFLSPLVDEDKEKKAKIKNDDFYKISKDEIIDSNTWRSCFKFMDNFRLCSELKHKENPPKQHLIMEYYRGGYKEGQNQKPTKVSSINCIHTGVDKQAFEALNVARGRVDNTRSFISPEGLESQISKLTPEIKYAGFRAWARSIAESGDKSFDSISLAESNTGGGGLSTTIMKFVIDNEPGYINKYLQFIKDYCTKGGDDTKKDRDRRKEITGIEHSQICIFNKLDLLKKRGLLNESNIKEKVYDEYKEFPYIIKSIAPEKLAKIDILKNPNYCDLFFGLSNESNEDIKIVKHLAANPKSVNCDSYKKLFEFVYDTDNKKISIEDENLIKLYLARNPESPKKFTNLYETLYVSDDFDVRTEVACNKSAEKMFPDLHSELIPCNERTIRHLWDKKLNSNLMQYEEFKDFPNDNIKTSEKSIIAFGINEQSKEKYPKLYKTYQDKIKKIEMTPSKTKAYKKLLSQK